MIGKHILKEIIVSNEEFITKQVRKIVDREGIYFPETLNKAVVFYGVRRSGKTFMVLSHFEWVISPLLFPSGKRGLRGVFFYSLQ